MGLEAPEHPLAVVGRLAVGTGLRKVRSRSLCRMMLGVRHFGIATLQRRLLLQPLELQASAKRHNQYGFRVQRMLCLTGTGLNCPCPGGGARLGGGPPRPM